MKLYVALIPAGYTGDYSDLSIFEIPYHNLEPQNRPTVQYLKVADDIPKDSVRPILMNSDGELVDASNRVWSRELSNPQDSP